MEISLPTPLRTAKRLVAIVIAMAPACSSSGASPGVAGDGGAHTGGATSSEAGGSMGSGGATHSGGARQSGGTSSTGSGGKPGADGGGVQASAACVTFCDCMATNCADKVFPGGCLAECAAQTNWDLGCRQNMCTLAPLQPSNDHCTHAFGVNECLDK